MNRARAILAFWFGDASDSTSGHGQQRQIWFKKDPDFDTVIRQKFLTDYEKAAREALNTWLQHPRSCLALILLLDQVPRNIFRGSPQSFATDTQARLVAHHALSQQWDQTLIPVERLFLYLPFEHSEVLADQDLSVRLFEALAQQHPDFESTLQYAKRHHEIVHRFGRFPHRNTILDRQTTPEEAEFLKQPGSGF